MKTFVTPEMARDWLSRNDANRNLSLARAREYSGDMLAGRWNSDNRQGIQLGSDGTLVDGQHRLMAVCLAANEDPGFKGIDMWVYENVPPSVRGVVDFNRVRSVGDVLHIEGHKHGQLAGAASGYVLNWLNGEKINAMRSKTEKHEFILNNLDLINYAALASATRGYAVPSALAAILFLASRSKDREGASLLDTHAEAFVDGIANGAMLKARDPRLALRTWMFNQRNGKQVQAAAFAATVQAWNNFVAGHEVAQIRTVVGDDGQIDIKPIVGAPDRGAGLGALKGVTLPGPVRTLIEEARQALLRERAAATAAE
jgi:hypothetical protein